MNRPSVSHEIRAGPGIGREERVWQEIAFQPIAVSAGEDHVARMVDTAVGEWVNVIQRGCFEVEGRRAVHTASAAIAHRGAFDGALVTSPAELADARAARTPSDAGETGEHGAVMLSAN